MEREVIQIAVTGSGKIVALCSDNTIWVKEDEWVKIKQVPGSSSQDED